MRKFNVKKKDGEKLTIHADSVTFKDGSLFMYKNEPCAGGLVRGELAGIISDVIEFYEIRSSAFSFPYPSEFLEFTVKGDL